MEELIQKITKKAGAAVLKRFGKDKEHYRKSAHRMDAVTKADLMADKMITSAIKKKYPTHGIISEESGTHNPGAEYVWVIDPIDGTLNFATGVPMFGTMVCLAHKGNVILSAISMPATREFFFAKAGKGAYCNGKRIRCSSESNFSKSSGYGGSTLRARARTFMANLLRTKKSEDMILGSFSCCANQCYTAAGRRDWSVASTGKIWDYAPSYLLLKEAGCKVTDLKGKPWKFGTLEMVAANPKLHKELLKLTKDI